MPSSFALAEEDALAFPLRLVLEYCCDAAISDDVEREATAAARLFLGVGDVISAAEDDGVDGDANAVAVDVVASNVDEEDGRGG